MSVVDAGVIGSDWWWQVDPAAAVDRYRQVVLAEGNHATAKSTDLPLPELAGLEVEADEDAEPQDQCPDLFTAFVVGCQGAYLVDRCHDGIDLSLWGNIDRRDWFWHGEFGDPAGRVRPFRHQAVEGGCDRLVAVVVFFGGHSPLRRDDVGAEFCQAVAEK